MTNDKKFLRDKAAHVSYMFMWMILLLLAFILTLLKVEWWVAAMLAGLSVLQYLIASVAFFYLERKKCKERLEMYIRL